MIIKPKYSLRLQFCKYNYYLLKKTMYQYNDQSGLQKQNQIMNN